MRAVTGELTWIQGGFEPHRAVLHQDGWISDVVGRADVPVDVEIEDWGRVAIMPGTVNAHGHAFQSLFKGRADDRTFDSWRDDVLYPFSERLDAEDLYAGALFAFAEAVLAGVTTTVDFFYLNDQGNANAEVVIRAARDVGINLVMARAFYDEDAPTLAPKRYREPASEAADRLRALGRSYAGDVTISVQPAPHSLHAAAPETIELALETAREMDVPCHLHLAEAGYEVDQIVERFDVTPVRLLLRRGLLDPRLVTIHTVWVDDEELDLLAEHEVGVVHCPGANAFLGDGMARVPEMLARGMRVGLGPDGGCANNRQSVFDEMRLASLFAKARLTDGSALGAPEAIRLGTEGGADLLKMPVGSLVPGRRADLVALDLDDLCMQPPGYVEQHVVHSMQPTAITKVMTGGRVIVDGGKLLTVPLEEVRAVIARTTTPW